MFIRSRGRIPVLLVMLLVLLAVGLPSVTRPTHAQGDPPERDYWPTDEWRTAAPESLGMDGDLLEAAHQRLLEGDNNVDSLIVVRGGTIVAEHYYRGYSGTRPHEVASVTKNVTSALVGIAIEQGLIDGVESTLDGLFPEYIQPAINPRAGHIRVADLLTMRSGLLWNSEGSSADYFWESANWVRAALALPVIAEPGATWVYNSAGSHLLAAMVARQADRALDDYADEFLFGPLGITRYTWETDPQGYHVGGTGLALTPRDMAKFGYLYLNDGYWDGQQVVPAEWVAESTAQQVYMESGGRALRYGYQWWLPGVGGEGAFAAIGAQGQLIHVSPAYDLVVVLTGDFEGAVGATPDLLGDYIIPAVLAGAG